MNPPQRPDLNIIKAVWDDVDGELKKEKGSQHPKESFGIS